MILALEEKAPAKAVKEPKPAARLSPLETEIIDFFVQLSRLLGQPRSLGEIYGLLFISERPLAMDDLIERLHATHGLTSILVTHNLDLAARCTRALRLEAGKLDASRGANLAGGPQTGLPVGNS